MSEYDRMMIMVGEIELSGIQKTRVMSENGKCGGRVYLVVGMRL